MNEEGRLCNITIQKALEDINAFPNLLIGYRDIPNQGGKFNLTYNNFDSNCSRERSAYIAYKLDNIVRFPFILIGGISYLDTSANLADRRKFPRLYRLTAPERVGYALVQLLAKFNWTRIAVVQEENDNLSMTTIDLMKELNVAKVDVIAENPIAVKSTQNIDYPYDQNMNILEQLKLLKNLDARIIVVSAFQHTALDIVCNAYKLGLYGKQFVWIFTERYSNEFWKVGDDYCTEEERQRAVEGAFFCNTVNDKPFTEKGIANITYSDLITDIHHRANVSESKLFDYAVGKCYDHVWVAALALNCSIVELLNAKTKVVAYFRQDYRPNSRYEWIDGALIWKDNIPPLDSAQTIQREKFIPMPLYLTMCVLAGIGIIFTIACFVFNVFWRKHRIVKMSSPNINSILLVGCLLMYVTIVIKTMATTSKTVCAVRLFCFWIGFATLFGSMFSKTWRVYRIFTNKQMKLKMSLRDKHLLVIIGILVIMETLVLIVWESYSPHQVKEQRLETEDVTTDKGDKVLAFSRVCVSDHSNYFNWTLKIVNGALVTFGAFLAWETRQVHIEALNDSKTIGVCLYNVVILSIVGLFLSMMLDDKPIVLNGVTSVCLFVGTLVSETLIFLPKILAVYRKPIATPQTALTNLHSSTTLSMTTNRIELGVSRSCEKETQPDDTTRVSCEKETKPDDTTRV
ncbi:gamma-aminobutyric acid type B receptor subunit 2-like isoform X2 [Dreissena polymorpha]|uniref:gamma-aminobutyric acid type B receptor subunit 2-like isoform X2 n=1 Tax=Dreissena polymorpha TaxID=45954 RepID=UPI00226418A9|nr:gamma-aminobutyric acid type B receptor subunit 2-like isoform X2 [Dreissena polymorpha]